MTDREKAIVMAYTGICMLQGDKMNEFYKYLAELYGRPVYTHEIVDLDIAEKSKADFVRICHEEHPERKKGKWIPQNLNKSDGMISTAVYYYPKCSVCGANANYTNFCPNCGAEMLTEDKG